MIQNHLLKMGACAEALTSSVDERSAQIIIQARKTAGHACWHGLSPDLQRQAGYGHALLSRHGIQGVPVTVDKVILNLYPASRFNGLSPLLAVQTFTTRLRENGRDQCEDDSPSLVQKRRKLSPISLEIQFDTYGP